MSLSKGDSFRGPPDHPVLRHPHFVLTDPDISGKCMVVVCNVTDAKGNGADPNAPVILSAGDHDWIIKDSKICYSEVKLFPAEGLENAILKGLLKKGPKLAQDKVQRLIKSIQINPFTPPEIAKKLDQESTSKRKRSSRIERKSETWEDVLKNDRGY